jgi:hypothetical protein
MHRYLALAAASAVGVGLMGRRLRRSVVDKRQSEHVSQTAESYRSARIRILILGAGFGGLATLRHTRPGDRAVAPGHRTDTAQEGPGAQEECHLSLAHYPLDGLSGTFLPDTAPDKRVLQRNHGTITLGVICQVV